MIAYNKVCADLDIKEDVLNWKYDSGIIEVKYEDEINTHINDTPWLIFMFKHVEPNNNSTVHRPDVFNTEEQVENVMNFIKSYTQLFMAEKLLTSILVVDIIDIIAEYYLTMKEEKKSVISSLRNSIVTMAHQLENIRLLIAYPPSGTCDLEYNNKCRNCFWGYNRGYDYYSEEDEEDCEDCDKVCECAWYFTISCSRCDCPWRRKYYWDFAPKLEKDTHDWINSFNLREPEDNEARWCFRDRDEIHLGNISDA